MTNKSVSLDSVYKIAAGTVGGVVLGATLIYVLGKPIKNSYEIKGNQAPVVVGNAFKDNAQIAVVGENAQSQQYLTVDATKKTVSGEGFLKRLNDAYDHRQERINKRRQMKLENRLEEIARRAELRKAREKFGVGLRARIRAYDARGAKEIEEMRELMEKSVSTYDNK